MAPSTPSSHRPRKKRRPEASAANGTTITDSLTNTARPAFPLVAFFWPVKSANISQWITLPVILMIAFLFRWTTALWPYSGQAAPPMHGDFEAQRHWMELTINLPVTHWYWHDLQWWGLDYPPLTAYHSWILGQIGWLIRPEWFQLYLSRGLDDARLKTFMRATVAVSEFAVYIPAAVWAVRQMARLQNINGWESSIALTALLMQPATILIDHGHFQYNTVMLGFALATIAACLAKRPLWSCVFFVCALGFKQMALFYAPAVAAYLAGICLFPRPKPLRLVGLAIVTLTSFALLFLPLLLGTAYDEYRSVPLPADAVPPPLLASLPYEISEKAFYHSYLQQLAQAIHRIFPFSRGLFEDKVANIWCAVHSSGIYKLTPHSAATLSRAALLLTLASITPPCFLLFFKPKREVLVPALATTAWGFFLCSYQVHEKNVLLPLLPVTLMLAAERGMRKSNRAWIGYANMLGCFTMFPLLKRDGLQIPYFVLTGLWGWLMGLPPFSISAYFSPANDGERFSILVKLAHLATYGAIFGWHIAEAFLPAPEDKPDLWVVANVVLGAGGFGLCYLWCLWSTIERSGVLYDLGLARRKEDEGKKKQ